MEKQWHVFINGVMTGPYTDIQVTKLLSKGLISANDKICKEEDMIWKKVQEFDEFSAAEVASKLSPKRNLSQPKEKNNGFSILFGRKKESVPVQDELPVAADQNLQGKDVHFKCPECGQRYSIPFKHFNGKETCQVCSVTFLMQPDPELSETAMSSAADAVSASVSSAPIVPRDDVDFSEEVPEGNITCPHCWKTFSKENVCYISCHPDLLGDPIAGEFEQKRFVPTVYHSNGLPLDSRGMPCTDMACPHCHLRIPATIIDLNSIYFSIVGAPSSGKSYFLTSMVHSLRKCLPENNLSFYDVDPVINRVLNGYEDTIFMAPDQDVVVSLPKTQQIGGDFSNQILKNGISFELPKPFIFRLQEIQPSKEQQLDVNVVFYDNAGEHFQPGADSIANPATTHLAHSDGIVFLFDPLNDANMRKNCDQKDPQTEINTKVIDQTTLFAEMVNRIRRHGNMVSGQTSEVPLIIAVGKYDTWKNQLSQDITTVTPLVESIEDFRSELDWNKIMNVSFAIRELMQSVAPAMVAQAESFFQKVIFVPISSFGCLASKSPKGNIGIIPSQLHPVWVDIPIILLLAERGIFPRNNTATGQNLENSLVCKVQNGQIIFRHPVTGKRVLLPEIYENIVLEIAGKKYKLPPVTHKNSTAFQGNKTKISSIWE